MYCVIHFDSDLGLFLTWFGWVQVSPLFARPPDSDFTQLVYCLVPREVNYLHFVQSNSEAQPRLENLSSEEN